MPVKTHQKFRMFEDKLFSYPIHGPEKSMAELRALAGKVWKDLGVRKPFPQIVAGRGLRAGKSALASYELGGRIVLARHHRYKIVLLHELSHYIANDPYPYHGLKFFRVYRRLLLRYSDVKTGRLIETLRRVYNLPGD